MSSKYAYQLIPEEYILGGYPALDLGEHIRKEIKKFSNPAGLTKEESEKLNAQIDSLERIANNTYAKKYPRVHTSTATGLTAEQCSQVLTAEFLEYLNDEKQIEEDEKLSKKEEKATDNN